MLEGKLATADQLVAKRTGRLESATAKRAALAARLAELGTSESDERPRPMGYCLKERLRVAIVDPRAVVLANGRPGVAGTCPGCGSRIVRLGAM
jgi:hypothetical protein